MAAAVVVVVVAAAVAAAVVAIAAAEVVVAAVAVVAVAAAAAGIVAEAAQMELHPLAIAVGEGWASELVTSLRADDREIIGAWPGTLGEARMRIRGMLRTKLELPVIDELARVAYIAARRGWQEVSKPDPEP